MFTPEHIEALRILSGRITDPVNDFLLEDIARRISEAGQLTSTAAYQIWRMQNLGLSRSEIKKRLEQLLQVSGQKLEQLLTQTAEVGYRFDITRFPQVQAVPFQENIGLQNIIQAAVKMAGEELANLTQTIGMVDPYGKALPLQEAYRSCTDFAFQQVITGATDYNTAIRMATKNLAGQGVRVIDYESGVHTSLEAAVRRNVMGGLGLMNEQINRQNHDALGCDGWEISAHANSAPDHEPIQGKQYPDAQYEALNNSLRRRIGTLNCGHTAFPIIMGVNEPQYTPEELEKFCADNAKGVTYNGKHYTGYEATQQQRRLERAIRKQKNAALIAQGTGDEDALTNARIRLQVTRQEYTRFSQTVGLRTENERIQVAGFGSKEAAQASAAYKNVAKQANLLYDKNSESGNVAAWIKDQTLRAHIRNNPDYLTINAEKQARHLHGEGYVKGRSYLTVSSDSLQEILEQYAGTGRPMRDRKGNFTNKELIVLDREIGVSIAPDSNEGTPTNRCIIHYSKTGAHIVPTARGKEKP